MHPLSELRSLPGHRLCCRHERPPSQTTCCFHGVFEPVPGRQTQESAWCGKSMNIGTILVPGPAFMQSHRWQHLITAYIVVYQHFIIHKWSSWVRKAAKVSSDSPCRKWTLLEFQHIHWHKTELLNSGSTPELRIAKTGRRFLGRSLPIAARSKSRCPWSRHEHDSRKP